MDYNNNYNKHNSYRWKRQHHDPSEDIDSSYADIYGDPDADSDTNISSLDEEEEIDNIRGKHFI